MIVGADDMDDEEGMRRGERSGDGYEGEWEGEREAGAESAVNAGEDSADSNVSKKDEDGVWYIVFVVVIVPAALSPPPRKSVERLRDADRDARDQDARPRLAEMSIESVRGASG